MDQRLILIPIIQQLRPPPELGLTWEQSLGIVNYLANRYGNPPNQRIYYDLISYKPYITSDPNKTTRDKQTHLTIYLKEPRDTSITPELKIKRTDTNPQLPGYEHNPATYNLANPNLINILKADIFFYIKNILKLDTNKYEDHPDLFYQ